MSWPGSDVFSGLPVGWDFGATQSVMPVVGPTGRGKSTLLDVLSGLARPKAGSVSWTLGSETLAWTAESWSFRTIRRLMRRRFGFLMQDARMIPCFTVGENIRHSLRLRGMTSRIDDGFRHLEDVLIKGSEDPKKNEVPAVILAKYPRELSGGQRQRVALAMAIAHEPTILFADEPTASLDDTTAEVVLGKIREWLDNGSGPRALICVTHRLEGLPHLGAKMAFDFDTKGAKAI